MFLPVNVFDGDRIFWDPQLTLTRNHVKLEAEGSVHDGGPLSFEWTTSDIVSIESAWSVKLSHVGLRLYLRSMDGESVINVEDSGNIKLDWEVAYPDWPELQNKIWALDSRYKDTWITDSDVDASAERVRVYGFNGVESDREIKFLPVNVFNGDKIFWDPQLTLTRNHVKLEAEGSVHDGCPLSFEWNTSDIVSIESAWSEKLSHVGLRLSLRSKDGESVINVEDSGNIKLDWEVAYPDWPELQNKIWALDSRYKDTWITDSDVDAVNIEDVLMDKFSGHHFRDSDDFFVTFPKGDLDAVSRAKACACLIC